MRARQLVARPRRLVPPRLLSAGVRPGRPPNWRPHAAGLFVDRVPQFGPQPEPSRTGVFAAAGEHRAFDDVAPFWLPGSQGLLFAFHLHGFADLARYAAGRRSTGEDAFWEHVLGSWLRHAGTPRAVAWHPYPTSGRIIAWCSALALGQWDHQLRERLLASAWQQARYLARVVEHDIGGNHVLRNATALVVAGVCLGAERLERRGLRLLRRELGAQLLTDGGHEERSPAYHRQILDDLDDLASVLGSAGRPEPSWLQGARSRMRAWQAKLAAPDGSLPLFNDAWAGPPVDAVADQRLAVLGDSGYVVLRHGRDQAVFDAGPLAPPHLPPHAHADALSFTLWADGAPIVVDRGVVAYTGPRRRAFRATRAHSTVEVDGRDQCELWGDFRAAFLPRVEVSEVRQLDGGTVVVRAHHDGYRRLKDPVVHERLLCWLPGDGVIVVDHLVARAPHAICSRLQLAPGLVPDPAGRIGPLTVVPLGAGEQVSVVEVEHAPYLGHTLPAVALERAGTLQPGELTGWALVREATHATLRCGLLVVHRRGHPPLELWVADGA